MENIKLKEEKNILLLEENLFPPYHTLPSRSHGAFAAHWEHFIVRSRKVKNHNLAIIKHLQASLDT